MHRCLRLSIQSVTLWLLLVAGIAFAGTFDLTIVHTNDVHSHLAAFDAYGAFCTQEKAASGDCQGGFARLATAVALERGRGENVLLLDAGDQFQGTLFFTKYKGRACAELMNRLGYDAMTLGNHEFDDGPVTLSEFLKKLSFPALAVNLDATASPALSGRVAPWRILERGGRKVGIIGVANPQTAQLSNPGPALVFHAPNGPVEQAVAALEREGVNIIVLLSHLGLDGDRRLATEVAGVDVIVGGHSHVLLANGDPDAVGPCPLSVQTPSGGTTLIVTSGYWGRYLGVLHASFDDAGRVVQQDGNPIRMDASIPEEPGMAAEVATFADGLRALQGELLGEAAIAFDFAKCRENECLLGDVRAESILASARRQGAVAALVNGGSVRSSIGAGPVTLGDVLTAFPFPDSVMALTLSGADMRLALEHGVSALGGHDSTGRFLQVAGVRYTFDSSQPVGERVLSVDVADLDGVYAPLDEAKKYRIGLTRFLYRGGDGFKVFSERGSDVFNDGDELMTVTADYFRDHSPLAPVLDGRIQDLSRQ